jgi:hypothetical protein
VAQNKTSAINNAIRTLFIEMIPQFNPFLSTQLDVMIWEMVPKKRMTKSAEIAFLKSM